MKILNVRRAAGRPIIAHFDIDFDDGAMRVVNCYIKRNGAGELRVYAPSPGDHRVVTFNGEFASKIINAALAAMEGRDANDINKSAA